MVCKDYRPGLVDGSGAYDVPMLYDFRWTVQGSSAFKQTQGDGRGHLLQGRSKIFPVDAKLDFQVGCSPQEVMWVIRPYVQ